MTVRNADKKAIQALNFFATKEGGSINRMKAIKLIWLSDRAHLRRYGRTILNDKYYALPYGPVPSNTKNLSEADDFIEPEVLTYRDKYIIPQGEHFFDSKSVPDLNVFSESDIAIMEVIYSTFKEFDQFDLSELSHLFPEWKRFKDHFKNKKGRRTIRMDDFFDDTKESLKYFKEPKEQLNLSKEVFEEGCVIN